MVGLIWGFLGTMFGLMFWICAPSREASIKGFWLMAFCAPMWAVAYHFMPLLGPRS
jgi:hypothetical protein